MAAPLETIVANPYRCEECGDRLTIETGVVAYSPWAETFVSTIAHEDCAPSSAYLIGFDRLLKLGLDGPNGWRNHLCRKPWWTMDCMWVLEAGHKMVLDLVERRADLAAREPLSLMRSVTASIPRRRPRTPNNPRNIPSGTRARVLERDAFKCRRCGNGPDVAPLVIDHIQPVAKGGTAAIENLQTLCQPCNAGKRDRDPTPHDLGARQ